MSIFSRSRKAIPALARTLGANWLSRVDVEIDPLGKQVGFYPASRCGADVVRWPHSDFAELPVRIDRTQNLITIPMILDGREVSRADR